MKVLQDGLSRAMVCTWANTQIEVLNHQYIMDDEAVITKFTSENFFSHFNKHVSANMSELWAIKQKSENTSSSRGYGTINPEDTQMASGFITNANANSQSMNSFITMSLMVSALKTQIEIYTEYFTNYRENHPGKRPDINELEKYQKLIAGYIQSEQEMTKFKNSGEITGKAIEEALWKIVSELSTKIKEVSETVKLRLQDILPMQGTSVPNEIEYMIKQQFTEYAKMVVPDIINQVRKDYKLQ
jgi:hypothetical protein